MDTISIKDAIQRAELVSKKGGTFSIVFFPYSRTKGNPGTIKVKSFEGCTCRLPLPHDKFDIDGKNYFLFNTADDKPRSCYRCLLRYISFSDENKLKKIIHHG